MKRFLVVLLVLVLTGISLSSVLAGEKEELTLKRDLFRERITRLGFEFQVLQTRMGEIPREYQAAQKELTDTEKKITELKEDKK